MQHDDYTIALICALPVELAAARALLSDTHAALSQEESDSNIYTLGCIGKHNVVITSLPAGTIGVVSAAVAATRLQSSFPSIRIGLMVGIGGGIPSKEHDIRLGDVVVSRPVGTNGGVIQYDLGKTVQDGKFEMTGQLNRPPPVLLNAVQRLHSEAILGKGKLKGIIAEMAIQYPNICSSPGQEKDKLFESSFDHPAGEPSCSSCDTSRLVIRETRSTEDPEVHYGLIASGNQVIRHGLTRDKLGREQGALCVEMEAAGLMDSFPCLVIRGICDYADSHKNKEWQAYAACTAAAYAKELIDFIPRRKVAETRLACERIQDFDRMIRYRPQLEPFTSKFRDAWSIEHFKDPQAWKTLISRISDYDRVKAQVRLSQVRVEVGSGKTMIWYENRLQESGRRIADLVGSTRLIDHLKPTTRIPEKSLIFFYCEASEQKTTEALYLMSSLVRQVLTVLSLHEVECPREVQERIDYLYNPTGPQPDLDDLIHIFSKLYSCTPSMVCIVDGLDEINPKELPKVVDVFNKLAQRPSEHKLFIASRDEMGLNIQLKFTLHTRLLPQQTEADVKIYIEAEMTRKSEEERMITQDMELLQQVKDKLFEQAHGMFLWVRLQIEALWLDCFCDADIHLALASLPRDIDAIYDRCIARMPERTRELAAKALRWLACARRPLQFQELQEAVSYSLSDTAWSSAKTTSLIVVFSACVNLITINHGDSTIRLAHPSVKQYLFRSDRSVLPGFTASETLADLQCGEECINYLTFSDFGLKLRKLTPDSVRAVLPSPNAALAQIPLPRFASRWIRSVARSTPSDRNVIAVNIPNQPHKENEFKLLDYARNYWAPHTKAISHTSPAWRLFRDLALQPSVSWKLHPWISSGQSYDSHLHGLLIWASRERHIPLLELLVNESGNDRVGEICNIPSVDAGLPALHIAARQGLGDVTSTLLKVCDVNALDGNSRTALHHCAEKGHMEVAVHLATQRTVKLSAISTLNETALGIACSHGFGSIVGLLTTLAAPLKPKGDTIRNPMVAAAVNGHATILDTLLQHYGESSLGSSIGSTCLLSAAESGDEAIVKLLAGRKKVNADSKDEWGQTALLFAAARGHEGIVKFLLSRAEVSADSKSRSKRTPLHHAAAGGHEAIVKLLVEHSDVDNNSKDKMGRTPLMAAMMNGHESVVKLFVERNDTTINSRDISGQTALGLAIAPEFEASLKLLLKRQDIIVNWMDHAGRTPLSYAAERGYETIIKLLVDHGNTIVDIDERSGETPLSYVAARGLDSMVKLLLERKDIRAYPNEKSRCKPLLEAVRNGRVSTTSLLCDHDDSIINLRDRSGRTALSVAAELGSTEIGDFLLQYTSTEADLSDNKGRSPLSYAAGHRHESMMRLLVCRRDVNINSRDGSAWTPLTHAAFSGLTSVVALLLSLSGIEADPRDNWRRTPLSYAAENGHESTAKLLLTCMDVNAASSDQWDRTPQSYARQNGHEHIVMLLQLGIMGEFDGDNS